MRPRLMVVLICLATGLVAAMPGTAWAQGYSPEWLFRLEFGEADHQVGVVIPLKGEGPPMGPHAIAAGPDGSIYIADRANQCVKRFDERGNLLMRTQGEWENVCILAMENTTGNVYTLSGAGLEFLTKFGPDGRVLWSIEPRTVIPDDVRKPFWAFGNIYPGPDHTVCIELGGHSIALAVLDSEGHFLGIREGYTCTEAGKVLSFAPVPGEKLALQVFVSDFEGRLLNSYTALPVPPEVSLFADVPGFTCQLVDSADYLYTVAHGTSTPPIALSPDLTIASDVVVTRYDPSGNPVAQIRFPAPPTPTGGRDAAVDPSGNIYHLAYEDRAVNVIRYRLGPAYDGFQRLQELPMLTLDRTRYVPLKLMAACQKRKLQWDPQSKQALLLDNGSAGKGGQPVRFRVGDPGVRMHQGRLWVSKVAYDRMGVVLRLDPKQQVACLQQYTRGKVARGSER